MRRLLFVAYLVAALAAMVRPPDLQLPPYRPVNLGDLVKSLGENRDGLEGEVDLALIAADHATFGGDNGVGFASRVRDEPDGPMLVAWRRSGELWIYTFLDDDGLATVRAAGEAGLRLGRIDSLRAIGQHLVIETRDPVTSVVLRPDLSAVAHAHGSARAVLASGDVVLLRSGPDEASLALLDLQTRRTTTFYTSRGASLSSIALDAEADALTFTVTADGRPTRVTCAPMSQASRTC